jgi:hypothetical protein
MHFFFEKAQWLWVVIWKEQKQNGQEIIHARTAAKAIAIR